MNFLCEYKPLDYSGVIIRYKLNNENYNLNEIGKCNCTNVCICENITLSIFKNGKFLGLGFKSIETIEYVLKHFKTIINNLKLIIEFKPLEY